MPESQTQAVTAIRKQPYTPGYQFVPQPVRTSPIPPRFEGQIPVALPPGAIINTAFQR
jgi:hypothetical protein